MSHHSSRFPVVSVGLVRWIECVVKEPSYFKLCTESTPTHLALLDEVVSIHPLLHSRVLSLLVELFESEFQDLEILVQVCCSALVRVKKALVVVERKREKYLKLSGQRIY